MTSSGLGLLALTIRAYRRAPPPARRLSPRPLPTAPSPPQIDWLLDVVGDITNTAVGFDIAFRVLQTVAILMRYWAKSSLYVAPVDVTTDAASKAKGRHVTSGIQSTLMLITSGPVLALVGIVFFCTVTFAAYAVYKPFFEAYYEGCVETYYDPELEREVNSGSETWISKNVRSAPACLIRQVSRPRDGAGIRGGVQLRERAGQPRAARRARDILAGCAEGVHREFPTFARRPEAAAAGARCGVCEPRYRRRKHGVPTHGHPRPHP